MVQEPSPKDSDAPVTQVPGQLSLWDEMTRQLMEAIGAGDWTLIVDDDPPHSTALHRRRRRA